MNTTNKTTITKANMLATIIKALKIRTAKYEAFVTITIIRESSKYVTRIH